MNTKVYVANLSRFVEHDDRTWLHSPAGEKIRERGWRREAIRSQIHNLLPLLRERHHRIAGFGEAFDQRSEHETLSRSSAAAKERDEVSRTEQMCQCFALFFRERRGHGREGVDNRSKRTHPLRTSPHNFPLARQNFTRRHVDDLALVPDVSTVLSRRLSDRPP